MLALTTEGKGLLRRRRRRGGYNIKMEFFMKEVISVWTGCVYSQIGTRGGLFCETGMYHHVAWNKKISVRAERLLALPMRIFFCGTACLVITSVPDLFWIQEPLAHQYVLRTPL
jgi:hypothetical protein